MWRTMVFWPPKRRREHVTRRRDGSTHACLGKFMRHAFFFFFFLILLPFPSLFTFIFPSYSTTFTHFFSPSYFCKRTASCTQNKHTKQLDAAAICRLLDTSRVEEKQSVS